MKKIFQAASSLLILASCAGSAGTQDMTPADALISRLYTQVEAGKIICAYALLVVSNLRKSLDNSV